jgi:CRISPR-associated protein Cas1
MGGRVGSGDPDNIEARAARAYWGALFDGFVRDDPADLRNKLLNYGYAVMRAAVARALVAYGCLPAFGLHHASVTNAFNLADDFLEPFRPFVDALAAERADGRAAGDEMTVEDRRAMAGVLSREARLTGEALTLLAASEKTAESYVRAMEGGSAALLRLPEMTASTERGS